MAPPASRVWHWAQRVLKRLAPFLESPVAETGLASWCCRLGVLLGGSRGSGSRCAALRCAARRSRPLGSARRPGIRLATRENDARGQAGEGRLRARDSGAECKGFEKPGEPLPGKTRSKPLGRVWSANGWREPCYGTPRAAGFEIGGAEDNRNPAGKERKSRKGRTRSEAHFDGWVLDWGWVSGGWCEE